MSALFGEFRVRVDPWEVSYGEQAPVVLGEEQGKERVELEVEVGEAEWRAIRPGRGAGPQQRVIFVDGVRRLEVRVQARQGEQLIYGGFGSFAVGAVVVAASSAAAAAAAFGEARVGRVAVLGAGARLPGQVRVREHLFYEPESTPKVEADGPMQHLQGAMRRAEATLAGELCGEDTLMIVDGPLSFEPGRGEVALGYIKRIHELYLPTKLLPLLATLPAGARTPLFSIQSTRRGFARYSWFQRLAAPGPGVTELHGLVRLEVAAKVGIDAARALADAATRWLPRIAPTRARDPRSPQNLLPIGALEQRLRVLLGDARLFRRWIEALVAKESSRG